MVALGLLALCSLSLAAAGGATLGCSAQASHCGGFSCCGAQLLGPRASGVAEHGLSSCGLRALGLGLSSCGARAYLLHGMWNPPGPGIEPMLPALAGRFLSTVPPGKSSVESFNVEQKKKKWAKILDYGYRLDRGLAGKENPPEIQETPVWSRVRELPWRRAWEPTAVLLGFPGGSDGKEFACNAKTWAGKIPWRKAWQSTPVFLPGESPWTEEPSRLHSMEYQRAGHDWATKHSTAHTLENLSYNTHQTVWPRNHWSCFNWKQSFKALDGIGWTRKKRGQRRGERVDFGPRRLGLQFLKRKLYIICIIFWFQVPVL